MKKLLFVFALLLLASDLTEITAKDKKIALEARVAALELRLQQVVDAINGPVSNGLQLMDDRTIDLNNRLHKYELNQADDKASTVKLNKSYANR